MTRRQLLATAVVVGAALVLAWAARPERAPGSRRASAPGRAGVSDPDEPARVPLEGDLACAHPYVPTCVGTVLEYTWEGPAGQGTVRLALLRARAAGRGTVSTWSVDANGLGEIERRCDAAGAEEPWIPLSSGAGIDLTNQTWRVPRELAPGVTYGGTIDAGLLGLAITLERTHTVTAREEITVGGHRYHTLRVGVEERTSAAAGPTASTIWIAREVGLVRLEYGLGDERSMVELRSVH